MPRAHISEPDILSPTHTRVQRLLREAPRMGVSPPHVMAQVDNEPAPRQQVLAFAIALQEPGTPSIHGPTAQDSPSAPALQQAAPQPPACVPVTETSATTGVPVRSATPPEAVAGVSGGRRSERPEAVEEKRVRNSMITQELGVVLEFPTYKEGVSAIHGGVIAPFTAADIRFLQGIRNREN